MPTVKPPTVKPPTSLGDAGKVVWKAIASKYVLRPDELVTLEDVCVFSDEIADLTDEWVEQGRPRTTKGSMGQLVEHPHPKRLADLRMKRNALWRQLGLPDEAVEAPVNQQRDAANSKWATGRGRGA
jgi:hypothetical protein